MNRTNWQRGEGGVSLSFEEQEKLKASRRECMNKKRREKVAATKGLTAAQRMMGVTMNDLFIEQFNAIQKRAHEINVANGWWDERLQMMAVLKESGKFTPASLRALLAIHLIGLIHTEPSEAVESFRKPALPVDSLEPHSAARELAGTIIRIMDMAEVMGIPVAAAIVAEIEHNAGRGRMHGGNVA